MTITVVAASQPILQFFADDGTFLVGGQLYTSVGGIPYPTYADAAGQIQHANPIILNSRGEIATSSGQSAQLFLVPNVTYTFALFDAQNNPIDTPTNIQGIPTSASITELLTSQTIGELLYPQTPVEAANNVAPTIFIPSLRYDPYRYGAQGDGFTDDTTAMQTAINIAVANNGRLWLPDNSNFLCGALLIPYVGDQFNNGLVIEGAAQNGSRITVNGTPTSLLSISAAAEPSGFPLILENFSIVGASTGSISTIALQLTGLAQFMVRGMVISGCAYAVQGIDCLTCTIEDNIFANNSATGSVNGIHIRGPNVTPNMVKVSRNTLSGWAGFAIDFDNGSEFHASQNDIEQNGTNGTIPSGGGIHIGSALEQSTGPALGEAQIFLEKNWAEGNAGWGIQVDAPTNGSSNTIVIRGGWVISPQSSGKAVIVAGCQKLDMDDFKAPDASGSSVVLNYTYGTIKNCAFNTLTDTGLRRTYTNVTTPTINYVNGYTDNYITSLTGCTTVPTVNVQVNQQGNLITLYFYGAITGTSNSTTATLTGLPAAYWPVTDTIDTLLLQNNGTNAIGPVLISAATGVITLNYAIGFTNSGGKGVVGGQIRYRIP